MFVKYGAVGWRREKDSNNKTSRMFQHVVQPLTFGDLQNLIFPLPDSYQLDVISENFLDLPVDNVRATSSIIGKGIPIDIALFEKKVFHVCLDMDATDKELVDNFKSYLKAARDAYDLNEGQKIKTSKSILNRLINESVIPYLDLIIWAQINNKTIPQHILGDWLFPDAMVDVAEKIRKVTRPLAERAVTPGFINTLSSLPE